MFNIHIGIKLEEISRINLNLSKIGYILEGD